MAQIQTQEEIREHKDNIIQRLNSLMLTWRDLKPRERLEKIDERLGVYLTNIDNIVKEDIEEQKKEGGDPGKSPKAYKVWKDLRETDRKLRRVKKVLNRMTRFFALGPGALAPKLIDEVEMLNVSDDNEVARNIIVFEAEINELEKETERLIKRADTVYFALKTKLNWEHVK